MAQKRQVRQHFSLSSTFGFVNIWFCHEQVIVSKRRFQYEDEVKERPYNYDAWFDYIRLEESAGDAAKVPISSSIPAWCVRDASDLTCICTTLVRRLVQLHPTRRVYGRCRAGTYFFGFLSTCVRELEPMRQI